MKIAVIGSSFAGLTSALILSRKHDVVLYEQNEFLGEMGNNITLRYHGQKSTIDGRFMLFSPEFHPNCTKLFDELGVETVPADMGFSVRSKYLSLSLNSLRAIFSSFSPSHYKLIYDILRFSQALENHIKEPDFEDMMVEILLAKLHLDKNFLERYFFSIGAAAKIHDVKLLTELPISTCYNFMLNNNLLISASRCDLMTLRYGNADYIKKVSDFFGNSIRLATAVLALRRDSDKITIVDSNGGNDDFDHVVIATNAYRALDIVSDTSYEEYEFLSSFKYAKNTIIVHHDSSIISKKHYLIQACNYSYNDKRKQNSVTYLMNLLAGIEFRLPVFVTMNQIANIKKDLVCGVFDYNYPIFDHKALNAQKNLENIQGKNRTWFIGNYLGYGGYEDMINAALNVADKLGTKAFWQ